MLGLLAGVAGYWALSRSVEAPAELDAERAAALQRENEGLRQELAALPDVEQELAGARESIQHLENGLAEAEAVLEEFRSAQSAAGNSEAARAELANEPEDTSPDPRERLWAALGDPHMRRIQASSVVDMGYSEFLAEFDPARREALREALIAARMEEMEASYEAMQAGAALSQEESRALAEARDASTRQSVAGLLSPQELQLYDAYAEQADGRIMAAGLDVQLGLYAAGMTPENRALAREVLLDEFLATQDAQVAAESSSEDALQAQIDAMRAAQERIRAALPEDQQILFDQFVERQIENLIQSSELMR